MGCREGNCIDFCDFPTDLGCLPLTPPEMGLDREPALGSVNYVQNIEITIELSQFQPLFVQSWQESWENSALDASSSLQNVNGGYLNGNDSICPGGGCWHQLTSLTAIVSLIMLRCGLGFG